MLDYTYSVLSNIRKRILFMVFLVVHTCKKCIYTITSELKSLQNKLVNHIVV